MTSFGERLKQLMEDQSISQRDLAAALNISKSTVSGYVNSYREPDFKSLFEIASIFHVTTDYLLGNSDIPSLPISAHNNQSILLLSYFEQLSPEVQNIVLKEVKSTYQTIIYKKAAIPTFHGITASFISTSYFIAFFQRIVSCIILPPVFVTGFLLHPIFLGFHPVLCRHLLKYFLAPSTLRYTLCPHSLTFWQPASAYFPVPVSFLLNSHFHSTSFTTLFLPVP